MPVFVALLRGVNVGKAKRVPMADLRALLGDLGHTDVVTLLNSGNAVFSTARGTPARLAADIAGAIRQRLQVEVPVIVKSASQWAAIVAGNPLAAQIPDPSRLLVACAQDASALHGLAAVAPLVAPPEQFVIGDQAAYLHCPAGILESKAAEALLGRSGKSATTRNWGTVLKLHVLVRGAGARRPAPA